MFARHRILVLESSPLVTQCLEDLFAVQCKIMASQGNEDILALVASFKPDAIIIGVDNSHWDSFELCTQLRETVTDPHLKIIMMSQVPTPHERYLSRAAGADDYIRSPNRGTDEASVSMDDARARVNVFLRLRQAQDQVLIAEGQMAEREAYLRNVLSSMGDGFLLMGADSEIEETNISFAKLMATQPQQIVGKKFLDIIAEDDLLRITGLQAAMKDGQVHGLNVTFKNTDGQRIPVAMSGATLTLQNGDLRGYVIVAHDMRELLNAMAEASRAAASEKDKTLQLEEILNQLEEAKNRAEAADRIKTQFVANMSHEIRTPMTAILGFADLLLEPQKDHAATKRIVETIRRNGQHLLAIINDILDITKIEAGKMTVESKRFSPIQLFVELQGLMSAKIKEKNLSFEIKFDSPMPEFVFSDPTRLRQILVNLIGNAVKFTEEGTITLTSHVDYNASDTGPQLVVAISDTGIGMTPEQAERVFERFEQADTSTTRRFGGTGLGLSISYKLAALLQGGLRARSELGVGTTFICNVATGDLTGIKLIEDSAAELTTIAQCEPEVYRATQRLKGRILVADDGKDNRALILFRLNQVGASVDLATNGREAYEQALSALENNNPFDLILMDMQMPEVDGYTATAKLRREGYTGPIIALTAHTMATDRERCLAAGCDDYASKPIDFQQLISLAGTYMESELGEAEPVPKAAPTSEFSAQINTDSSEIPLKSVYADDELMADLITNFVNGLESYCNDIENGIKTSDLTVAQRRAHQLAGAGGSYGFGAITEIAKALEEAVQTGAPVSTILEYLRELYVLEKRARLGLEK